VTADRAVTLDPAVAEGVARLAPAGGGAAVRGACALMWVEGPDAASFLHGLVSNDVLALAPGDATHALLLDERGHVRADMRVARDADDAFTLVVDPDQAGALAEALDRYHFSEALELIGPEPFALLTVGGAGAVDAAGAELTVPGRVPGTVDLVVGDADAALAALGLPEAPAEALEALRVEAGVPRVGVDTGAGTLVQEAGLETRAVSFDKGCYLGQETVARAQYRGRVNRRLRGLRLEAPAQAGAAVRRDGRELGRVSSAAVHPELGPIALATLRREAEPGAEVEVEGVPGTATVTELPFPR
jgi:folate-binding protein YgfZ